MDAFEQLVSEILFNEGYWVQTSVKVALTKEEKRLIGRHSAPRWELDVVGYKPSANELIAIECKSFLDSTGVQLAEFKEGHKSTRYKLFREQTLRETILARLVTQMVEAGRCPANVSVTLGMVAGKIKPGDENGLAEHFEAQGWLLYGPKWLRAQLEALAQESYTNQVSSVVAKLLLRPAAGSRAEGVQSKFHPEQTIKLLVSQNPKRAGSKAHARFEGYFEPNATTIQGALSCGVEWIDIRHDVKHGFIEVGPPPLKS